MALADRFRYIAQRGREFAAALAQRPVTVTVRVEQHSGALGVQGTTLSSTTDTVITPAPKVRKLSAEPASWYGGGAAAQATGQLDADVYEIGPITRDWTVGAASGGYTIAQLAPTGGTTKRVLIILSGDGFPVGGEAFEIVSTDEHRPQSIRLVVKRTRQS